MKISAQKVRGQTPVKQKAREVARLLRRQATVLGGMVGAFWGVFAINSVLGGALNVYGVIPRSIIGLRGIIFAPFLHANFNHLLANTLPFAVLGWLVMLRDRKHFLPVTLISMLGAGLLSWLLGAPGSVHIGASGVIFGYLGFLLLSGWYARNAVSIVISLAVAFIWGSVVVGVLPGTPGISWQAHLGGFTAGVLAARYFKA